MSESRIPVEEGAQYTCSTAKSGVVFLTRSLYLYRSLKFDPTTGYVNCMVAWFYCIYVYKFTPSFFRTAYN